MIKVLRKSIAIVVACLAIGLNGLAQDTLYNCENINPDAYRLSFGLNYGVSLIANQLSPKMEVDFICFFSEGFGLKYGFQGNGLFKQDSISIGVPSLNYSHSLVLLKRINKEISPINLRNNWFEFGLSYFPNRRGRDNVLDNYWKIHTQKPLSKRIFVSLEWYFIGGLKNGFPGVSVTFQ